MSRDLIAGVLTLSISAALYMAARDLQFGSASEMGPGFLPIIALQVLAVLSLALIGIGVRPMAQRMQMLALRPLLLVGAAIVVFAVLLRPAGTVAAVSAAVVVTGFAGTDVRWKELVGLAIGLAALVVILFIHFLKLPMGV